MRLDIQQLLASDKSGNSTLPFELALPLAGVADLVDGTAYVAGGIRNHGGYLELVADTTVKASAVCGRCGEQFAYTHSFNTTRPVAKNLTGDEGKDNKDNNNNNSKTENSNPDEYVLCDYIFCDDEGFVDLEAVFGEELLLELPVRYLCDEDCKGLCPKCGENLNKKACGCSHKEIDPRLEVLKKLLNND